MKRYVALALAAALLTGASGAAAQVHGDVSGQVGINKRFLFERPAGADDAGFGPNLQLAAHLALFPLVRAGVYLGQEIAPLGGDAAARDITYGGLRGKLMLPFLKDKWRSWIFLGFGYAIVHARSFDTTIFVPQPPNPPVRTQAEVLGAGGGYFEVPVGIGVSYKFFKPWEVFAELGGRFGFAHHGSVYEDPGRQLVIPGRPNENLVPAGTDGLALGLSVGLLLDL